MTTTELQAWSLSAHIITLPFSLVALYRYSDRSTIYAKSLRDTDDLLDQIGKRIVSSLEDELSPVFERADSEPRLVTVEDYSERSSNPVGSDVYREALQRFVERGASEVADYGELIRSRKRWCAWARVLSWTVLTLAIWEFACVGILGFVTKFLGDQLPDGLLKWSFGPTTVLIVAFFFCQALMLRQHDVIHEKKNRYHAL